jgi:serine/threonine-protein kinase
LIAGKYRIERKLGAGGMGAVYAAKHEALGVRVAIKVVLPAIAKDGQVVARFLQEARAAARIEGEHIARVTDVGTLESGAPYMVMELLEGEDLGELVEKDGALEPSRAVRYVTQALSGLSEAHALGVVHRDLKPSNLFVVRRPGKPDRVKVLDFGISKTNFEQAGDQITATGSLLGSPAYMSPEQLRSSKSVDVRADIWSVGVILYEVLTGKLPFHGDNVGAVFAAILENEPVPPRALRGALPQGLSDVVLRCLRRKPEERFQTVEELAAALAPFASTTIDTSMDIPGPGPTSRSNAIADTAIAPSVAAVAVQTQGTWSDRGGAESPKRKVWPLAVGGSVVVVGCAIAAKVLFFSPVVPVASGGALPAIAAPSTAKSPSLAAPQNGAELGASPSTATATSTATAPVSVSVTATATGAPSASAKKIGKPKPTASASSDEALFQRH